MRPAKQKKSAKYYLKKAAVSAVGAAAAASLLVSGVFSSPAETVRTLPETPPAVVQIYEPTAEETPAAPEKRRSLRERVKERLLVWPLWLRAVLLLPLWGLGTGLSLLIKTTLPALLRWFIGALLPLLLTLAGIKTLFPDIPLSSLLCKKNRIALIVSAVLLLIAGPAAEFFFPQREWAAFFMKLSLLALLFATACLQIIHRRTAAKRIKQP